MEETLRTAEEIEAHITKCLEGCRDARLALGKAAFGAISLQEAIDYLMQQEEVFAGLLFYINEGYHENYE